MNAVSDLKKTATAFEEASHAVIHHHFRREIAEVVATNEGSGGYCQLTGGESAFNLTELRRHESLCRSIMAKLAAKCVAQRLRCYDEAEWKGSADFVKATRFALELNGGDQQGAELLLAWLQRKTELLISELWPQVSKLAYALLDKQKLSGCEVREIIESHQAKRQSVLDCELSVGRLHGRPGFHRRF
jgi:hypothetical protein